MLLAAFGVGLGVSSAAPPAPQAGFYTVPPCRVADTRNAAGPYGGPALAANSDRNFTFAGRCGIPTGAEAIVLNVTVTQATAGGSLRLYGSGGVPTASAINYTAGRTRANNGSYGLSASGDLVVRCDQSSGAAHVILDVSGYHASLAETPPPPTATPTATRTPTPVPPTATRTPTSSPPTPTPGGSRWSKRYGDVNDDRGHGVAVDGSGDVAVTGHYQGITDFGNGLVTSSTHPNLGPTRDVFVASYTPTGGHIWSRSIGGVGSEEGNAVAVDGWGNVLVTGYQGTYQVDYGGGVQSTAGSNDIFVAKYSSTGGYVWSKTVGGTGYDSGMGIAADSGGNVFVTGGMDPGGVNFGGGALFSAGFQDVFLVKYSAAGAHVWSKRFGGSSSDSGAAVGTDAGGNVVVTGTFEGSVDFGGGSLTSAGGKDIFVAKYSSSGAHLWSRRFGGSGYDYATGIAADGAGDVAVTGKFQNSINFGGGSLASAGVDDAYLAKLSGASGGHVWSKRFGSTSGDNGAGVAVDASNNVAVTGHFAGTVDFGGGGLTASSIDVFVAKYNASGAHLWSRKYGAAGYQFGSGVAMARTGEVSVTGFFASTVDFGTGSLTSAGANDAYVASIGP